MPYRRVLLSVIADADLLQMTLYILRVHSGKAWYLVLSGPKRCGPVIGDFLRTLHHSRPQGTIRQIRNRVPSHSKLYVLKECSGRYASFHGREDVERSRTASCSSPRGRLRV